MKKMFALLMAGLLVLFLTACTGGSTGNTESSQGATSQQSTVSETVEESSAVQTAATDEINPEFKKTVDDCEAFFDEYVAFMQKYQESGDTEALVADYTDFMTRYTDMMAALEEIDESTLNDAEKAYYTEVSARILQKVSEVAAAATESETQE